LDAGLTRQRLCDEQLGKDPAVIEDDHPRVRREHHLRDRVDTGDITGFKLTPGVQLACREVQA
jgi:hypothetical protein